jgi:hypothetical protein
MKILSLLLVLLSFSTQAQMVDSERSKESLLAVKSYLRQHPMSCGYWSANNGGAVYIIPATQALWFLDGAEMSIEEDQDNEIIFTKIKKFKKRFVRILLDNNQTKIRGILGQTYELYPKKVNVGTLTEPRFETVIHEYLVKQTKCGILQ